MARIPVNLAHEPFERVRAARRLLGRVAAVVIALTALHGAAWFFLRDVDRQPVDVPQAALEPARVGAWVDEVDRLAAASDSSRVRLATAAVEVGNQLIDWRSIPWPRIFADLERLLPRDVRLEIVAPAVDERGAVQISMTAAADDPAALRRFVRALETDAAFEQAWPEQESIGEDGLNRMILRARHRRVDPAPDAPAGDGGRPQ